MKEILFSTCIYCYSMLTLLPPGISLINSNLYCTIWCLQGAELMIIVDHILNCCPSFFYCSCIVSLSTHIASLVA